MKKIYILFMGIILFISLSSFTYSSDNSNIKLLCDTEKGYYVEDLTKYDLDKRTCLRELGLKDNVISNFSNEELDCIESVYSTTNIINFEDVGIINENAKFNVIIDETYWGDGDIDLRPSEKTEYIDEYMEITYTVIYLGEREYSFFVDAKWLQMPNIRLTDSLGIISMDMTVINSSRNGYYSYDYMGETELYHFQEDAFVNAIEGNWYGSACVFEIPGGMLPSSHSLHYSNFSVHYAFRGHYRGLDDTYFNTLASYDHMELNISISPEIKILSDGGDYGIGFDIIGSHTRRNAEFPTDLKFEL